MLYVNLLEDGLIPGLGLRQMPEGLGVRVGFRTLNP